MSQEETEKIVKGNVLVKVGTHKLTIPIATVILAILGALGTAYRVVQSERQDAWDAIHKLETQDLIISQKLELEQVVLAEIRTQLVRIDARVAEVQVTLMRGSR